jgi:hypothetical protein
MVVGALKRIAVIHYDMAQKKSLPFFQNYKQFILTALKQDMSRPHWVER